MNGINMGIGMEAMGVRENFFTKMWNNLVFRLLWVIISTVLPLNLVAVLMASTIIYVSARQMQQSFQWGLEKEMEHFERGIGEIEKEMDSLMTNYQTELTLAEESDNMVNYEMVMELGEVFADIELTGMFYVYDRMQDRLYVKYDNEVYTIRDAERVKAVLVPEMLTQTEKGWRIAGFSEQYFLKRDYEYPNYRIGFLVDLGKSFYGMMKEGLTEENRFYVSDGRILLVMEADEAAGNNLDAVTGVVYEESQRSWEELFQKKTAFQTIVWEAASGEFRVGMQIHGGSVWRSVPVFYWILLVITLICMVLIGNLWKLLQKRIVRPLKVLQDAMQQLEQDNWEFRIDKRMEGETKEFNYIYDTFNQMAEEIRLSHEKDIRMLRAQLDNLRLQVNPHMLLNSFNMIYSLAETENYACIQEFSLYLVEYFRYVLKENDTFVTLSKEMKFVESYINIQRIRFPDAFTSVYSMQKDTEDALVPPLLVQNFVENAMKYALIPDETIEVLINIRKEEDRLLISICDTGRGIREDVMEHIRKGEVYQDWMGQKHIGIWNCRQRMEVFYGGKATMNIVSAPDEGTQVWLDLPWLVEEKSGEGKEGCR